jgi:hypothetical protein
MLNLKTKTLTLCISMTMTTLPHALMAQDSLDTVNVTDGKGIKSEDVYSEPKSFQNNTQTFKREDFQSLPVNNAYEMLDYATGTFVQTQGRKSPYFASVRAGSNLGIIIDGAYLPAPAASKVLMQLPITAIESMTVVRDASALNLGPLTSIIGPMTSSRTEGFIVIKTLSAFKTPKTEVHSRVASHGQVGLDGTTSLQLTDEVAARVVLGKESKDGAPDYFNGYEKTAGIWKLEGYHDKLDWQINFFHADGYQDLQRGLPSSNVSDAKWSYDPMTLRMINSQAGYHWNDQHTTAARFGYSESNADLQQYSHSNPSSYKEEKTVENFANLDISHAYQLGQNMLRLGYNQMRYHNPTGMLYYPGFERKELIHSLYLQDEYRSEQFTFDFGVRTDKRTIEKGYEQVSNNTAANARKIIENVELDDLLTGAIGGTYSPVKNTLFSLRTLYTEQQPVSVYTANNNSLPKEQRIRLELGWNQAWHKWFNTTLTGFKESLENAAYIERQINDPANAGQKLNVYGSASWENTGVELDLKGQEGAFGYHIGLSQVNPGATPTGVVNVPKELIRARVFYQSATWTADLGARSMDSFKASNQAGSGTAGGFATYDASLGRGFKWEGYQHKVAVFAKNFTDEHYETVYGFANEGATYGVDYRVQF